MRELLNINTLNMHKLVLYFINLCILKVKAITKTLVKKKFCLTYRSQVLIFYKALSTN